RSGGREAIEDVLAGARPLAQMLWARESEAGPSDTPERRAALEARIGEVTGAIADEVVRRYYKQDFSARLRQMFAPQSFASKDFAARRRNFGDKGFDGTPRRGNDANRFAAPILSRDEAYVAASAQLAACPLPCGYRPAIPLREALLHPRGVK